jgi:hypothetical protein
MVGLASENGACPIDLLEQHESRKVVGKREWREAERCFGTFEDALVQAVSPADQQRDISCVFLPPR